MLERHNFRQLLSFLYKTKHDFINLQSQLMGTLYNYLRFEVEDLHYPKCQMV